MNRLLAKGKTFLAGGFGCLSLFALFAFVVLVCGGKMQIDMSGWLVLFVLGGVGSLVAVSGYQELRRVDAQTLADSHDYLLKAQFWYFAFGALQRDEPVDVKLFADRMVLDWGMWFWKSHREIPWNDLTIVPAATLWMGNDPNFDRRGLPLRWDTWTEEPHKGWKCIWLPCEPASPFYTEVQRLIASAHPVQ